MGNSKDPGGNFNKGGKKKAGPAKLNPGPTRKKKKNPKTSQYHTGTKTHEKNGGGKIDIIRGWIGRVGG